MKIRWIVAEVVTAVHDGLVSDFGGSAGIRDAGLLDSALARPKNLHAYDKKASIHRLAAAYAFGLAKNHPFVDGNKRVALTIAATFLELNGHELIADEAETVVVFNRLAAGDIKERELALWFQRNTKK